MALRDHRALGFLGLVAVGNLAILAIFLTADPLAVWVTDTTRLNFFQINTVAHILFGVGLPRTAATHTAQQPLWERAR